MLAATFLALTGPAWTQGTLLFNTSAVGARVYRFDDLTPLAGTDYVAQLYVGLDPDGWSLVPVGAPAYFRTGALAGYITAGTTIAPGFAAGAQVFVQMRAWEAAGGANYQTAKDAGFLTGESNLILVRLGGGGLGPVVPGLVAPPDQRLTMGIPGSPALLTGLQGFVIGSGGLSLSFGDPRSQTVTLSGTTSSTSCGWPVGPKVIRSFAPDASGYANVSVANEAPEVVLEAFPQYYLPDDERPPLKCGEGRIGFGVEALNSYWVSVAAKPGGGGTPIEVCFQLQDPTPRLAVSRESQTVLRLEIAGPVGCSYSVEQTSLLPATAWSGVAGSPLVIGTGPARLLVPVGATSGATYFRARWNPQP